jgi:hypothetical protein
MTKNFDLFVEKLINSFEELPSTRPYGFWISPKGKIYSVITMDHVGEGKNIVNYFEPELKEEFEKYPYISEFLIKQGVHVSDFLIKKGFLRTVFMEDEMLIDNYYYDVEKKKNIKQPPTNKAKKTAQDIAIFYNTKPVFTQMD